MECPICHEDGFTHFVTPTHSNIPRCWGCKDADKPEKEEKP